MSSVRIKVFIIKTNKYLRTMHTHQAIQQWVYLSHLYIMSRLRIRRVKLVTEFRQSFAYTLEFIAK